MGLTKFKFILWYDLKFILWYKQQELLESLGLLTWENTYAFGESSQVAFCIADFLKIFNCWSLTDFKAINYCNCDWCFSCSHMAVWKHSCNRNKEARGSFTLNCITWVSGFSEASLVNITWYKGTRIQFILTNLECLLCEMLLEQQKMTLKFFFLLDFE